MRLPTRFGAHAPECQRLLASTYLSGTGNDGLLNTTALTPRPRHNYGDAFWGDLALDP